MQQSYFSTQRPAHGLRPLLTALVCFGSAGLLASTTVRAQPTITAVAPQANARAAAGTGPVTITFDQALTAGSAAALKVYSSQRGGLRTRGATPAVVSGSSLVFTPSNYPFVPGETVYSTVTTAAQATAGGALAQARVQQFTAAVGGTGRGNFALASTVAVPNDPNGIAAGDVDNDGDLDLVMANTAANAVTVLRNNGSGTYTIASTVAMPQRTFTVALGDVDGDGDLDVVAAVAGPGGTTVSTRLNGGDATGSGTGTFSNGSDVVVGDAPTFLALGDMDGDGDLDVAVTVNGPSNNGSTVRVCLNGGDGTGSNTGVFSSGSSITVGPNAFALALGDVDNDGDLDLAASITGGVKISLNAGNGTFGGGSTVALSVGVAQSVVLADVNADGYLDLLTELNVRLNTANGSGTFGGGSDPSTGGVLVVAADIDADGDLDMAIASEGGGGVLGVKVLFNNGAGGFPTGYDIPLGEQLFYLASADVDGDGDLDLLGAAPKELNSLKVLINGPAAAPTLTSFTPTSGPAGTTVTLNGTNLTGTSVIAFGGPGNNTVTTGFTVSAAGTQITGVVVPGGAQTGTIRVTTPGGTATSPASFTVPLPVLTGISPSTGAAGTSVTLTGTNLVGAVQVSFNGTTTSTFTSNSATQLVLAVPAGATSGSVTVTTPAGTSNALSFTVPCPVATIAYGATSYCQTAANPTPTVTGPAGGTFNAPTGLSLDAVTGAIALAASTPGTYTVSYTAGTAACPTTATASVTVTAAPVATFAYGAPAYCTNAGAAVAPVLASNATAGTFTAAPAGLSLDANTGALTLASSQPGTYTVTNTVAGSGGCAGVTATTTVVVNAAPTASIAASGPTTFCAGGSVTLTASGGTSYLWSTGATTADITVTAAGAYSVVVTNAAGCSATSAATAVTVNPATTATFAYSGSTFCVSGANPTPAVTGTAGGTFSSTSGLSLDAATGTLALASSTPGTYVVTYNVAGTCPSSATASVTITGAPVAAFSYAAAAYCLGGTAGPAPVFAAGASAGTFTGSGSGLVINASTGVIDLATSTAGTYTVTNSIGASGGCAAATATTQVVINAVPAATITTATPTTFCQGGVVLLTAPVGTGATYQFLLNGSAIAGATSATYSATASGDYTVAVTNAGGCSATSAATTVVVNAAPATPTLSAQYNGTTTTLTSSVATGNQFFLNGVAIAGATGPIYVVNGTPAQLGAYTVVTTNAAGCASAPSAPLTVTSSVKPLPGSVLHVYPTPTTGELTVELAGYRRGVELTIVNTLGQVVYTAAVSASLNTTKQAVNLSQLPAGIYILRAKTAGGLDMRRVVKE